MYLKCIIDENARVTPHVGQSYPVMFFKIQYE